jgi:hypothetical protein
LNHVHAGAINRQWPVAVPPMLSIYFRFPGIADMAGLAAGSTRSRMTPIGHFIVQYGSRAAIKSEF